MIKFGFDSVRYRFYQVNQKKRYTGTHCPQSKSCCGVVRRSLNPAVGNDWFKSKSANSRHWIFLRYYDRKSASGHFKRVAEKVCYFL